jgi:hypothetical protein
LRDAFALCKGLWYGGGLPERAASQSKGVEDDMEGVAAGERYTPIDTRFFGVVHASAWLLVDLSTILANGELDVD